MASKPRRRRHNKQTPAYATVQKQGGGIEQIPVNRKAFKVDERSLRLEHNHDVGVIKRAIYGIGADDVVHIKKSAFKNEKRGGHYSHKGEKLTRKAKEAV